MYKELRGLEVNFDLSNETYSAKFKAIIFAKKSYFFVNISFYANK